MDKISRFLIKTAKLSPRKVLSTKIEDIEFKFPCKVKTQNGENDHKLIKYELPWLLSI